MSNNELDPLQKGTSSCLLTVIGFICAVISLFGLILLVLPFIIHRPMEPTLMTRIECGAMVVVPIMFFNWVKEKLSE